MNRQNVLRLVRFSLAVALMFALGTEPRSEAANFQGLGDLPGGAFASRASAVSADGLTVVGYGGSPKEIDYEAFRWTEATGMVGFGVFSFAWGVSRDGLIVVGGDGREAFRWSPGTGMVGLSVLPGAESSRAFSTSSDGRVIVGDSRYSEGQYCRFEAFRWTPTNGIMRLGGPIMEDGESGATGVSPDGRTIVGAADLVTGLQAFCWTEEAGMVGLGYLPGGANWSVANAVTDNGTVIGSSVSGGDSQEAFRWTKDGGMVGLGDLAGGDFRSVALGMSANGSVIVGRGNSASGDEAFLWDTARGMRSLKDMLTTAYGLDLAGWELTEARVFPPTEGRSWVQASIPWARPKLGLPESRSLSSRSRVIWT
jgi:probable HAF family extracellular repeat protein